MARLVRTRMLAAVLALGTAACSDDGDGGATDDASSTTTAEVSTTTTAIAIDVETPPTDAAVIDEAYVDAVMAQLLSQERFARQTIMNEGAVGSTVVNRLSSVYPADVVPTITAELQDLANQDFPGYRKPTDAAVARTTQIVTATLTCIHAAVTLNLTAVLDAGGTQEVFVTLVPITEQQDDFGTNRTAWAFAERYGPEPDQAACA